MGPPKQSRWSFEHTLIEGDAVSVLGERFTVFEVPGHTVDHIAYYSADEEALFCGDTLFVGGCGRVFEGTPPQMRASLEKLSRPAATRVFCAHEYTLANLHFATLVEPDNVDLQEFLAVCEQQRALINPLCRQGSGESCATTPFSDGIALPFAKPFKIRAD